MSENPYAAPNTPEVRKPTVEKVKDLPLATRGSRFIASMIDGTILTIPMLVILIGIGLVIGIYNPHYLDSEDTFASSLAINLATTILMSALFLMINGHLLSAHGQTIGKAVMKIKIVSNSNELVPVTELFLKRYLILWVLGFLPVLSYVSLVNPLFIFRQNRKCLHDEFANTKVVMTFRPRHMRESLPEKIEIPN